jgi:hypothetical protein
MRNIVLIVLFSGLCLTANAADRPHLSGNLSVDLMERAPSPDTATRESGAPKKSVPRAVLYSAIVPGAGQAYVGNWWSAAAFFSAEVLGLTAAIMYNGDGNKQTDFFQNYADGNISTGSDYVAKWDVVKYATWINNYLGLNFPKDDTARIYINPNSTLKPWERVDWSQLNTLEKKIGDNNSSSGFSHTLPTHGQQQYYEEIGKYPQYGHGWDDADAADLTHSETTPPHLLYYSGERGKANRLYSASTVAVILVMLNHLVSAIEAAISSHSYNQSIQVGYSTDRYADGNFGLYPKVDFHIGF